jgi:hypothetical protein
MNKMKTYLIEANIKIDADSGIEAIGKLKAVSRDNFTFTVEKTTCIFEPISPNRKPLCKLGTNDLGLPQWNYARDEKGNVLYK